MCQKTSDRPLTPTPPTTTHHDNHHQLAPPTAKTKQPHPNPLLLTAELSAQQDADRFNAGSWPCHHLVQSFHVTVEEHVRWPIPAPSRVSLQAGEPPRLHHKDDIAIQMLLSPFAGSLEGCVV
jgi:hypothetical protein